MEDTMNDPLENLKAELARQNETLSAFEQTLKSLGDVGIVVPFAFLEELDELTTPRVINTNPTMPFFGIRG